MSFWNRTMEWLGLGPDEAYDDYDLDPYEEAPRRRAEPEPRMRPRAEPGGAGPDGVVRTMPSRPTFPSRDFDPGASRRADDSGVQPRPQRQPSRSREIGGGSITMHSSEPTTISPRRFDQAQEVADKFKEGQPVIMNLEASNREISRRLIDFASGLCYGLDGTMEKVASGVYLLKPPAARADGDDYDYDYDD